MTSAIQRHATRPVTRPRAQQTDGHELARRLEHVLEQLEHARRMLRRAQQTTHAAELALLQQRLAREQAAEWVAELADLAESLQRSLSQSRDPDK